LVKQIEEHNRTIREKAAAIPGATRGSLSVDQFCALPNRATIAEEILASERQLAAAREQDPIRNAQPFDTLRLPTLDVEAIERVLQSDLPSLDAAAAARVQKHLSGAAKGAEAWIAEGMQRLPQTREATTGQCPFCASDLTASPVIAHYRAYFSAEYDDLKRAIAGALAALNKNHGGEIPSSFERAVRVLVERRQFWSRFGEFPEVKIETAEIARDWRMAREALAAALVAKQAAPLERLTLAAEAQAAAEAYRKHQARIAGLNERLQQSNETVRLVKEQAASGNPAALSADIARLKCVRARHSPEIAALCAAYLDAKAEKARSKRYGMKRRTP
jgi:wobble nucleotide-excising tRNase